MKISISDIDIKPRTKVLVRVDFNLPLELGPAELKKYQHRLIESIPTIELLVQKKCIVILCSHAGRPKGKLEESLRLKPIGELLSELLNKEVISLSSVVDQNIKSTINSASEGTIFLLENLRFEPGEEANDVELAKNLSYLADIFVMDAFAVCHRAHASTVEITNHLNSYMGLLLEKEIHNLSNVMQSPNPPYSALMGGAKVSDKIQVIDNLLPKINNLLIGGGMANTFLKAMGFEIGESFHEPDYLAYAANLLETSSNSGVNILLPRDVVVSDKFGSTQNQATVNINEVSKTSHIMDIGPETAIEYSTIIKDSKTLLWNGPMGVFEFKEFQVGTQAISEAISNNVNLVSVVGGGSTAEAVEELGIASHITHVSTGGGASLDYLSGKLLPGIEALPDKG